VQPTQLPDPPSTSRAHPRAPTGNTGTASSLSEIYSINRTSQPLGAWEFALIVGGVNYIFLWTFIYISVQYIHTYPTLSHTPGEAGMASTNFLDNINLIYLVLDDAFDNFMERKIY